MAIVLFNVSKLAYKKAIVVCVNYGAGLGFGSRWYSCKSILARVYILVGNNTHKNRVTVPIKPFLV